VIREIVAAAVVSVVALAGCKSSSDEWCTSYKDTFVTSCTGTCAAKNGGNREGCASSCSAGVLKDEAFLAKCKDFDGGVVKP